MFEWRVRVQYVLYCSCRNGGDYNWQQNDKKGSKKMATTAGFEPTRGNPKRFLISRLNRSARLPRKFVILLEKWQTLGGVWVT